MARRDKRRERALAEQRVQRLLDLAEQAALGSQLDDAHRYSALAWRLSTRYQLDTGTRLKARVCRSCRGYLLPGTTSRTRLHAGKVVTTCLGCGAVRRRPLLAEKRQRRRAGADSPR